MTTELTSDDEIVIIGVPVNRARVTSVLASALLTDAELAAGQPEWVAHPNPLPAWTAQHIHH